VIHKVIDERNECLWVEKEAVYPHWVFANNFRLRPEHFREEVPGIEFLRIPLRRGIVWGFKSESDLELFRHWVNFKLGLKL
jgi:hypothetical protein